MDEKLWKILENINSWLKYAESKNAYILAFIGAEITLIKFLNIEVNLMLKIGFLFLGLCFLVCVISFFPKSVIPWWLYYLAESRQDPEEGDDLLFYGHIAKYSINQYIDKISSYLNGQIHGDKYFENLCGQIVINSGITNAKFNMFKISFWFLSIGQLFLIFSFIG
jgi:hypothetical protein